MYAPAAAKDQSQEGVQAQYTGQQQPAQPSTLPQGQAVPVVVAVPVGQVTSRQPGQPVYYGQQPVSRPPGQPVYGQQPMSQPGQIVVQETPLRPPNHMLMSICTCICCCWPLGIIAICFSCMVDSRYDNQDYEGANAASTKAKWLSYAAIGCGVLIYIASVASQE
mmetsp:Transcript_8157/g.10112  ORF Transcript_8157/g.10112 Transcript_8157/m.10112 type:complete len:165 (+) Transcript_8157:169-663(+)